MNCREIEELMPLYIDGDCSEAQRREIELHAASCARCRQSLDAFRKLERSLVSLKDATPSWKRAEARLAGRLGLDRRRRLPTLIFNTPFLSGLALIAIGIVLFIRAKLLLSSAQILGSRLAVFAESIGRDLARSISGTGGFEPAALITVYVLLTVLPLLLFRCAVLRFGRR